MCGLFGIMSYEIENNYRQIQETAIRIIGTEILQLLEDRGGDATGVAALFEDCNYMGLKMGIAATEFLSRFGNKKEDYEGWLNIMRKKESPTKMFIGHCRKSSVGNSINNANNHPLHINNRIIGVHNGTLTNHEAIFHNLECKRDGTVDSEAIFRLLYHFLNKGKDPFTEKAIQETCKRIHGTYSVIALNTINPNQVAVFRDGRPLTFALIKKLNILLIASEEKYIKHAIFKYNKLSALYKLGDDFIRLTKKDVSFATLNDDSLAIFDNRVAIDNLEIKDLIHSIKIPRTEKIWKNKIIEKPKTEEKKTTKEIIKKTEQNNTTKYDNWNNRYIEQNKHTKKNKTDETCILWSNKFNKLNLIKDDILVDNLLGIEIDTLVNDVFEINNSKRIKLLKYSATVKENQNNIVDKPSLKDKSKKSAMLIEASDEEVLLGITKTPIYINNKLYNHNKENNIKKSTITNKNKISSIEIDTSINTKAVELSEMTSKYKMKKYSNDEEAMDAIDIVDKSVIKAMPFYSLCNRIKRFAFKDGFYSGYVKHIKEQEKTVNINKLRNKKNKAEKKIRVLKTLSKVLSKVLFSCTEFNIFDVQTDLKEIIKNRQEIDSKTLKSIYSEKDLKDYNAINRVTTLLELTKNGEIFEK